MHDAADALRNLAEAFDNDAPAPKNRSETPKTTFSPRRPESPIASEPTRPKAPAPAAHGRRPESPILEKLPEIEPDDALASASALAELSGETSSAYDPGEPSAAHRRRLTRPDTGMMQLRATAVPILITTGLIMAGMGLWGVMVKAGSTALPLADRPDAGSYATVALACLPMGLCLFASAGFFFYQYKQDQKKLAIYEEQKKSLRGK